MKSLVLITVLLTASKGFRLEGPSGPLVAQLGGSVLLPCSAETPLPLEELEVEWKRSDSESLVHLFQDGEERPESQDYAYMGRVHFLSDELVRGNYSIVLNNVTEGDVGVYICKVYTDVDHSNITAEIYFERFLVTGGGVVSGYAGEEAILNCSLDSHIPPEKLEEVTWKRKDQKTLVLLYQDGEVLLDASDDEYRGRATFFTSEIPKGNFSMRLKDVRTEDKGEYICEAHSGHLSANTTVILQELGFSDLHLFILALCSISLVFSIGLIFWMYFHWKDTSQKALRIHFVLFLCPNILLGIGFITWGVIEGFLGEAVACSTVNFIRFLLLIKTAPYLNSLPGCFKGFKTFSATAENSVVTVIVFSVVFKNLQYIFVQLNTAQKAVAGSIFGLMWMSCIIAFISAALRGFKPPRQPARPRQVTLWEGFSMEFGTFFAIMLLVLQSATASLVLFLVILIIPFFMPAHNLLLHVCLRITFGYFIWLTVVVFKISIFIFATGCFLENDKERFGLMTVMVFLQFLTQMTHLDHPEEVPETCHVIVYLLGASGLSIVNSVTLMTELILKAGTGERNIADLRVIVLLAESFFICAWMPFELYDAWKRNKHRGQRTPNQRAQSSQMPPQGQEMEALSHPSAHP